MLINCPEKHNKDESKVKIKIQNGICGKTTNKKYKNIELRENDFYSFQLSCFPKFYLDFCLLM